MRFSKPVFSDGESVGAVVPRLRRRGRDRVRRARASPGACPGHEVISREQRRGVYDLAQVNAARAPDYFRLDLRAERTFTIDGRPLIVFAGAQNATNRRNFAGYYWNRRLGRSTFQDPGGLGGCSVTCRKRAWAGTPAGGSTNET